MVRHLIALSMLSPLASVQEPPVRVLVQERVIEAVNYSFGPDGQLLLHLGEDAAETTAVEEPLVLDTAPGAGETRSIAPTGRGDVSLRMLNGEILKGSIEASTSESAVSLRSAQWGAVSREFNQIASILCDAGAPTRWSRPGTLPAILLRNGDSIPAELKRLEAGAIYFDSDFGETAIEIERVSGVYLNEAPPVVDGREAGELLCELHDGQRWHVDRIQTGDDPTLLVVHRTGRQSVIDKRSIRRIVFPTSRITPLTALPPPVVETTSYLNETVKIDLDDSDTHRPRAVGAIDFAFGLTTRPRSSVTYALERPATHVIGTVGLDPVRGYRGVCDVAVLIDGTQAVKFESIRAQDTPYRFAVALENRRAVTFLTDFGPRGEVGDVVNWCACYVVEPR